MKNVINSLFSLVLVAMAYAGVTAQNSPKGTPLTWGTQHTLSSKILKQDRDIIIALPKDYDKTKANYPVLVMTDGLQNIWHTVGSVGMLARSGDIPPVIIVGIPSINRSLDFTPTKSITNPKSESGRGKKFIQFIEKEVLPFVETNYRTHPYRVLAGHSLGGLFAGYTLMNHPGLFDAHIIMSPAFWWNKEEVIEQAKTFFKKNATLNKTVFFGIGTEDGYGMRQELKRFVEAIKANTPKGFRFQHREMKNEGHMSAPLLVTYHGLRFIFSDMMFSKELTDNFSAKDFEAHIKRVATKYGSAAKQTGEAYFNLAYSLAKKNNLEGAAKVFIKAVEVYPRNVWLVDYLGKVYIKAKKIDKAIETYKKGIPVAEKYGQEHIKRFKDIIKKLEAQKKK